MSLYCKCGCRNSSDNLEEPCKCEICESCENENCISDVSNIDLKITVKPKERLYERKTYTNGGIS